MATRAAIVVRATAVLLSLAACSSSASRGPGPIGTAPHTPSSTASVALPGAVASTGCHAGATAMVSNQQSTLRSAGVVRNYLLTTPAAHQRPDPLVIDFHGYGEGDTAEALTTQLGPLGQHDGFIVVFPNGTGKPIHWDTSTKPGNLDVKFVRALLDHLEATQCVDEARIYATGLSQGAFMSSTMACVLSGRFAAVAPVSGVELPARCPTTRPVPILAFHGTGDPILHFNGGLGRRVLTDDLTAHPKPLPKLPKAQLNGPGYPAHVKAWAHKDGCRLTPIDRKLSPHVIQRVYPCPPGVAVQFDIILGGGHAWPGSAFDVEIAKFVGTTTTEINASATIWAFFQRFHLSQVG